VGLNVIGRATEDVPSDLSCHDVTPFVAGDGQWTLVDGSIDLHSQLDLGTRHIDVGSGSTWQQ
jgi:hypothetical protein